MHIECKTICYVSLVYADFTQFSRLFAKEIGHVQCVRFVKRYKKKIYIYIHIYIYCL